jgi:hypothetical protein
MIFLKSGDAGMIGKCDAYQARVDLLKILLEANYPDLPTLHDLAKMDTARLVCFQIQIQNTLLSK